MLSSRGKNLFSSRIFILLLIVFICSAFAVRMYQLDAVPAGMSWDEAAIGYNGFGIWTVHRDEWLHRVPLTFRSFGDYKAPFAIYLNGLFTLILGLNLWAIRLPFVLFGVATVIGIVFLIYSLYSYGLPTEETEQSKLLPFQITLLSIAALIAFSPWHIFFSRAGFESGIALGFIVWGTGALLYSLKTFNQIEKLLFSLSSILLFVLSLYTYHSAKIFVPLLGILLFCFFRNDILKEFKTYITAAVFGFITALPLLYTTIWGNASERFSQTTVIASQTLTYSEKVSHLIYNFFVHFSPAFLIQGQTTTLRHGDGQWGVLYITELMLVIVTIGWVCLKRFYSNDKTLFMKGIYKSILIGLTWILVGTIPAMIGFEVPHSNRALLSYPGYLIVESVGIFLLLRKLVEKENDSSKKVVIFQSIVGVGIIIHLFLIISFFHNYFSVYKNDSVEAFNYGYKEVFDKVIELEDEVDNIVITSSYGQPYIYALFFRKTNPIFYHGGSLFKYIFPDRVTVGDLMRKNALIVATPEEIEPSLADSLVIAPNGEVRFVIIRTKSE